MWFKQIQIFQLDSAQPFPTNLLHEKLLPFSFSPCLPSMPSSVGWVGPVEEHAMEDGPLFRAINGYFMLCLQIEEKILPATVIRQTLDETIKQLETSQDRKLRQKEKFTLKDEVIMTLLPRAFSRLNRVYAYVDTKNHWLVLGTSHVKKTEQFLTLFKKTFNQDAHVIDIKKISKIMTNWLKNQDYSTNFSVEKACVLQDQEEENRVIRCKQQDLFSPPIQALLKDGCEVIQLALSWQDRVNFVLSQNLLLSSVVFQDEMIAAAKEMEPETKQQQFDADFWVMTETLSCLLNDLITMLHKPIAATDTVKKLVMVNTG